MAIARIWRTHIDPARAEDYERFARDVSLPMFRQQPGFEGVLMLRDGARCEVITLWQSAEDIAMLDRSTTYKDVVARIIAQGFITGEQRVKMMSLHLHHAEREGSLGTSRRTDPKAIVAESRHPI